MRPLHSGAFPARLGPTVCNVLCVRQIWYKHKEMTPGDYITCSEGDGEDSRGSISEFAQDLSADNHIHYFGVDLGHLCRTEGAELPK
jgi:hypothetical protein